MALLRRVIGTVLRRVRQHQGRTLREVAEAAGVSLPYLSEVERGTKEASSEVLAAICRALGLPMPDLLDEVRRELLRDVPAPRAAMPGAPRSATPVGSRGVTSVGSRGVTPVGSRRVTPGAVTGGRSFEADAMAADQQAARLRLGCVTRRSGEAGSGNVPTVRYGHRGAPRSAARLLSGGHAVQVPARSASVVIC